VTEPRLMTRAEAAAYYGLSASTFSGWVAAGRLPGPLPGTRRWDRKAIDASLDKLSGIVAASTPVESPLAKWKRQRAAAGGLRKTSGSATTTLAKRPDK
jgi:excisionase family DNA binding protein